MTARSDLANAFETTLTTEMADTSLTAIVTALGSLSSPCIVVIEPDSDTQREFIRFDGTFGGSSFVTTVIGNRYLPGSAAGSGLTHPVGSVVSSIITQQHLEDLWSAIEADIADLVVSDAAFAAHDGGTDIADHPEATTSVRGFMSAADKTHLDDIVSGSEIVVVHGGFVDDVNADYDSLGTFDVFYEDVTLPAGWNSAKVSIYLGSDINNTYSSDSPNYAESTVRHYATNDGGVKEYMTPARSTLISLGSLVTAECVLTDPGTTTQIGLELAITGLNGEGYGVEFREGTCHYVLTRTS